MAKFTPQFPRLFATPGERCHKVTYRAGGRIPLQCVRRVHGKEVNHLMDVRDADATPEATTKRLQVQVATGRGSDGAPLFEFVSGYWPEGQEKVR